MYRLIYFLAEVSINYPQSLEPIGSNRLKYPAPPITLAEDIVDRLFDAVAANPGYALGIDLEAQTVTTPSGETFAFDFSAGLKERLLNGLDDIGVTLQYAEDIRGYEARRRNEAPWLFV